MAGSGGRKDEAPVLTSANAFAALDALKKKKKSKKKDKEGEKGNSSKTEPEKREVLFWAPAPLTTKSWADIEDDDDDDYYATTTVPLPVETGIVDEPNQGEEEAAEESESEEEDLIEVEDEPEDENETQGSVEVDTVVAKLPAVGLVPKDAERQLSKKELKKKGLEELDAVLAELGYTKLEIGGEGAATEKKSENNGQVEQKESAARDSKSAKKKKKKEKSSKGQELQDELHGANVAGKDGTTDLEKTEDATSIDVNEHLKKMASLKKRKSSKEMDAAARAAASEAAARNARLAAAKKKEKAHYNQQPMR